jgi:hypothetical protein
MLQQTQTGAPVFLGRPPRFVPSDQSTRSETIASSNVPSVRALEV